VATHDHGRCNAGDGVVGRAVFIAVAAAIAVVASTPNAGPDFPADPERL
jgi:hypothetical protein